MVFRWTDGRARRGRYFGHVVAMDTKSQDTWLEGDVKIFTTVDCIFSKMDTYSILSTYLRAPSRENQQITEQKQVHEVLEEVVIESLVANCVTTILCIRCKNHSTGQYARSSSNKPPKKPIK